MRHWPSNKEPPRQSYLSSSHWRFLQENTPSSQTKKEKQSIATIAINLLHPLPHLLMSTSTQNGCANRPKTMIAGFKSLNALVLWKPIFSLCCCSLQEKHYLCWRPSFTNSQTSRLWYLHAHWLKLTQRKIHTHKEKRWRKANTQALLPLPLPSLSSPICRHLPLSLFSSEVTSGRRWFPKN